MDIVIGVPDMNDSVSKIVLKNVQYNIRFTYNDTLDYWKFGLYDSQYNPILVGIKIVPGFPLNVFYPASNMPKGVFSVKTKLDRIGRNAFVDGKAKFIFREISE